MSNQYGPPNFLVLSRNGNLYSYWSLDIFLIDLRNNGEDMVTIWKSRNDFGKIVYVPTTEAEVRESA